MNYKQKIIWLVKKNRFEDALSILESISKKNDDKLLHNDIVLLSGRFESLKRSRVKGDIKKDELVLIENSIRVSILEILNSIFEYDEELIVDDNVSLSESSEVFLTADERLPQSSFYLWILSLLSKDLAVTFLIASIIFSLIFSGFYSEKVGLIEENKISVFLFYGLVANFLVSFICYLTPLISYIDERYKEGLRLDSFLRYPNVENKISSNQFQKLKGLLGFKTDFGLNNYYNRAYEEFKKFDRNWRMIWLGWMLLYFVWLINFFVINLISPSLLSNIIILNKFVDDESSLSLAVIFFNCGAHLFMLFSFLILYFKKEDSVKNNIWKFVFILLFFVVLALACIHQGEKNNIDLIVGSFAGFSIALLAGRLDSVYLRVPFWIIVILYLYAIVQPLIEKFSEDELIMALMINIALIAKAVLFLLMAWLSYTNRIIYYLISANREELELENNWDSISKEL